jgi:hypothetical protein
MKGYLVVLVRSEEWQHSLNKNYRGMDRLPAYPSNLPEEQSALDEYVFGKYKNKEGLIPSLKKARNLFDLFRWSPRSFEIIYCEVYKNNQELQGKSHCKFLGYDVAGIGGDFWSPVGDFPIEWYMRPFLMQLNEHGLFSTYGDAAAFLYEYRTRRLADYDLPLTVFSVNKVL